MLLWDMGSETLSEPRPAWPIPNNRADLALVAPLFLSHLLLKAQTASMKAAIVHVGLFFLLLLLLLAFRCRRILLLQRSVPMVLLLHLLLKAQTASIKECDA